MENNKDNLDNANLKENESAIKKEERVATSDEVSESKNKKSDDSSSKNSKKRLGIIVVCSAIALLILVMVFISLKAKNNDDVDNLDTKNNSVETSQTENNDVVDDDLELPNESDNELSGEYLIIGDDGMGMPNDDGTMTISENFYNYSSDISYSDIVVEITLFDNNKNIADKILVQQDEDITLYPGDEERLKFTYIDNVDGGSFELKVADFKAEKVAASDSGEAYGVDEELIIVSASSEIADFKHKYYVAITNYSVDKVFDNIRVKVVEYDGRNNVVDDSIMADISNTKLGPSETKEFEFSKGMSVGAEQYTIEIVYSESEKIK